MLTSLDQARIKVKYSFLDIAEVWYAAYKIPAVETALLRLADGQIEHVSWLVYASSLQRGLRQESVAKAVDWDK